LSRASAWHRRLGLYLGAFVVLASVVAVSLISSQDPDASWLRLGMVVLTIGLALWLPYPLLVPTVMAIWLGPNYVRADFTDDPLFHTWSLLELPALLSLGLATAFVRARALALGEENARLERLASDAEGIDAETGVFQERLLRPALESELARARRYKRDFAVMLVGVSDLRQRFDYREDEGWPDGFVATARILSSTRTLIDKVYRYHDRAFALVLPEANARTAKGLVHRLTREAKKADHGEPLPVHYGVTFFPRCATTVEDLLTRAEVALRLAEKRPDRLQIDGAEAPALPAPETLREVASSVQEDRQQQVTGLPVPEPAMALAHMVAAEAPVSVIERGVLVSSGPAVEPEEAVAPALSAVAAVAAAEPVQQLPLTLSSTEAAPLREAVSDLLTHLEETLGLIRALKASA
jgi:GGDEF domain-containing protein